MKQFATCLGVGLLTIIAPVAQGALQISYSVNGGAAVTCAFAALSSGPAVCPAFGSGPVSVSIASATSNSPGTATFAQEASATLLITSTDAATLRIWVASQDFTAPITPPEILFTSNLSTTSTSGSGTANLTSCVDTGNGLVPPLDTFCSPGISLTNAAQAFAAPTATSGSTTTIIGSLGSPYSLSQQITIALNAGTNVNVITSIVLASVPEPASIALFGGVLLFTGVALRRRFSQSA